MRPCFTLTKLTCKGKIVLILYTGISHFPQRRTFNIIYYTLISINLPLYYMIINLLLLHLMTFSRSRARETWFLLDIGKLIWSINIGWTLYIRRFECEIKDWNRESVMKEDLIPEWELMTRVRHQSVDEKKYIANRKWPSIWSLFMWERNEMKSMTWWRMVLGFFWPYPQPQDLADIASIYIMLFDPFLYHTPL